MTIAKWSRPGAPLRAARWAPLAPGTRQWTGSPTSTWASAVARSTISTYSDDSDADRRAVRRESVRAGWGFGLSGR